MFKTIFIITRVIIDLGTFSSVHIVSILLYLIIYINSVFHLITQQIKMSYSLSLNPVVLKHCGFNINLLGLLLTSFHLQPFFL